MAKKDSRPSWQTYFMNITSLVAERSTCLRRAVGAVIVKDKRILSTGYNGAPSGLRHCLEVGCLREQLGVESGKMHELCRGIHAEQNAICQAAKHGIELSGTTLYCSMEPCRVCAMLIISVGIKRVIAKRQYHAGHEARELFKNANVTLTVVENNIESYDNQMPAN